MAAFDFTNFERKGNIENDIQLNSAQAISEAVIQETENTLRSIKIFIPDLEAEIYCKVATTFAINHFNFFFQT